MSLQLIPSNVRTIVNAFRGGWLKRWDYGQMKAMPMMWPEWINGQPQWRMVDVRSYIEEGFVMNSLIYSAVMWKAKAVTLAPMRAYEGDNDNPERLKITHPLAKLISRPNEYQTQQQFMSLLTVYYNLSGNAFILLDRPGIGELPTAMYPLNPERVVIVPKDGRVIGYVFVPDGKSVEDGIPIPRQDMIHVKLPNPLDRLEGQGFGLSPVAPLSKSADADNRVTHYMYTLFKRGLMLGGVLQFKTPISEEAAARVKGRWREMYGGSDKWASEVGILDSGAEYNRIAPTFDELGFGAIDERNETRLLAPFGVAPILIGSRIGLMRSTYSNYEQARRATWEDTLTFEIGAFSDEFEYHLSPGDDTFVRADMSTVPALQKNIPQLVDSAYKLWTMSVPARIAFDTVGLTVQEFEGMDISYLPMGIRDASEPKPEPIPFGQPPPKEDTEDTGEDGTVNAEDNEDENGDLKPKKKVKRVTQPAMS